MPPYSSGIVTPNRPELPHLLDERVGELVLVVVLLGDREDLVVDELPDHLGDGLLLVGLVRVGLVATAIQAAPVSLTRESTKDTAGDRGVHS